MQIQNSRQPSLSYALLIYMCIIVVLITLIPFTFHLPTKIQISWSTDFPDFITNIILFLPIGFLFKLNRRRNKDRFCLQALGFGTLLSLGIEFSQLFVPGRYTQVIDVITNGMGAWLGALGSVILMGRLKEGGSVRRYALELPLMNLVYLLIPLMWLNGLSSGEEVARLWLMLLLGLLGCGVLASIYTHRFKDGGNLTPNKLSLIALSWFVVASLPALINFPIEVTGIALIIAVFVQIPSRFSLPKKRNEKRFELPTLKVLLPLYLIYLILIVVWPTTLLFHDWQLKTNFQELSSNGRIVFTFRFIELIAAFTLFGYMVAEMRGRKKEPLTTVLALVFFITLGCSVLNQITRGYSPLLGSNILEILFMTVSGVYGAMIYRLQLIAIQHL